MLDAFKKYRSLLKAVKVPLEDASFCRRVHFYLSKRSDHRLKNKSALERLISDEQQTISYSLDQTGIQESCSFRNVTFARKLVILIIDDKGKVQNDLLEEAIHLLKKNLYSLGPNYYHEIPRNEYILKVLSCLFESKEHQQLFKKISKPYSHKRAEVLIRETMLLDDDAKLTDGDVRRAVLSAWLTYLRQNVGSCFATAPAIMIQNHQSEQFLSDMIELLSRGTLKRTYSGVEYVVPLSHSWGSGDFKKPFQLNEKHNLGKCEGFYRAFKICDLFDKNLSKKKAIRCIKQKILKAFGQKKLQGWGIITNGEKVLKQVLMKHLEVNEEDLREYALKEKKIGGLGVPRSHKETHSCARYHFLCEKAKIAFKQVTDNALLKSWEFTLASFTETKAEFSRWNLYSSLGMAPDDGGGIGPIIYNAAKQRLEEMNECSHERGERYEEMFLIVKTLEKRMARVDETEMRFLKNDYRAKVAEMNHFLEERDHAHHLAHRWSNMYNFIIEAYNEKFKAYFQEVYDADMQDVVGSPYDDSPAGFRLVYKHGRNDTSLWTLIRNEEEFIDFLAQFFHRTETELSHLDYLKGLEQDFSQIVNLIVMQVRTPEFLETALYRMAKTHGGKFVENPLQHLDKIDKKPWVYTSGGTMAHLVSCYYCREELPDTEKRFVENETELLAFLAELVQGLPSHVLQAYEKKASKMMLMHSPTHAFLLKPGGQEFKKLWKSKEYIYTAIREQIVIPSKHFLHQQVLNVSMQEEVVRLMSEHLQEPYRHLFKKNFSRLSGEKSPLFFRGEIIQGLAFEKGLQIQGHPVLDSEEIDSILYKLLPLQHRDEAVESIKNVISDLPELSKEAKREMLEVFDSFSGSFSRYLIIDAYSMRRIIQALLLMITFKTRNSSNFHLIILELCQKRGLAMPTPIIFADTNWTKESFAFLVNPGTEELEMWKVEALGFNGSPMIRWKHWMDGSRKKPTWGVYKNPNDYGE